MKKKQKPGPRPSLSPALWPLFNGPRGDIAALIIGLMPAAIINMAKHFSVHTELSDLFRPHPFYTRLPELPPLLMGAVYKQVANKCLLEHRGASVASGVDNNLVQLVWTAWRHHEAEMKRNFPHRAADRENRRTGD